MRTACHCCGKDNGDWALPNPCEFAIANSSIYVCAGDGHKCPPTASLNAFAFKLGARLATVVARIGGAAEPFRRNGAAAEPRIACFLAGLASEPCEGAEAAKKPPEI